MSHVTLPTVEGGGALAVVHLLDVSHRHRGTKVDRTALESGSVDLIVVDLDDGVVLRVLFVCVANT